MYIWLLTIFPEIREGNVWESSWSQCDWNRMFGKRVEHTWQVCMDKFSGVEVHRGELKVTGVKKRTFPFEIWSSFVYLSLWRNRWRLQGSSLVDTFAIGNCKYWVFFAACLSKYNDNVDPRWQSSQREGSSSWHNFEGCPICDYPLPHPGDPPPPPHYPLQHRLVMDAVRRRLSHRVLCCDLCPEEVQVRLNSIRFLKIIFKGDTME